MSNTLLKKSKILVFILICICIILTIIVYGQYHYQILYSSQNKTFGATFMTMNNPFYEVVNNEIKKQIESKGDTLITLDPALDKNKQNEQIYYFIKEKVNAIFLTPIDYKAVEPALKKAKEANIPIIVVDAPVYNTEYVSCTIVSNNYDAGVQCAKDMMKKRKSANIMLLEHLGAKSAIDRIQGFKDTIKGHSQYRIINSKNCQGQIELAFPATEKMLKETSEVDVIMALNDPSAMGALAALEAQHKAENVLVYGVDGTPDCKNLINNESMTGTSAQYPIIFGQKAIEVGYQILNGEQIDKEIIIPVTLITKENISDFNIAGWQ